MALGPAEAMDLLDVERARQPKIWASTCEWDAEAKWPKRRRARLSARRGLSRALSSGDGGESHSLAQGFPPPRTPIPLCCSPEADVEWLSAELCDVELLDGEERRPTLEKLEPAFRQPDQWRLTD